MKRSKVFLSISAGVLAVVAFTAAKVARFTIKDNAYYHGTGKTACTLFAGQFFSVGITPATSGSSSSPANAHLYTFNNGGTCEHPLYKTSRD